MPLPQQVIEQLGKETETSQGWATGTILFCGGVLLLVAAMYCGMKFAYEPYVNNQIKQAQNQIATAGNTVSVSDEQQIINFYSGFGYAPPKRRLSLAVHGPAIPAFQIVPLRQWLAICKQAVGAA